MIGKFILATTNKKVDDIIVNQCKKNNIAIFRGSENDVLDRFYQASKVYSCDYVLRLTSDCPLIDPKLIDKIVLFSQSKKFRLLL